MEYDIQKSLNFKYIVKAIEMFDLILTGRQIIVLELFEHNNLFELVKNDNNPYQFSSIFLNLN